MKKGRAATMTHDYKRNGTTTLFAALNVLDGQSSPSARSHTPTLSGFHTDLGLVAEHGRAVLPRHLPKPPAPGVFTSVPDLTKAIDEYIAHNNIKPKPFIWTKRARDILQKVIRANARLSSNQNATLH